MTRLVLHAGLPKTGTTAFQDFAARNRQVLETRGLAYCDGFRGRNHVELAVAFSHRVTPLTRSLGVHNDADRAALLEKLPAMLGDPARATAVLTSSEHVANLVYEPATIRAAADRLHSIFDEVVVLMVLRRADYWTPSMYTESVKAGDRRPFGADFVRRHRRFVDHAELFGMWREGFGEHNVIAVPFLETDKSDTRVLPARLLEAAGVDLLDLELVPPRPQMQNTSLSAYGTELLRRLNSERRDTPLKNLNWRYHRVIPIVRRHWPGPSQRVTPEAADELSELGLIRKGISNPGLDDRKLWDDWVNYVDAETMPTPCVSDEDVERLVEMLRRRELVDRTWVRLARARARRLARRMLRR